MRKFMAVLLAIVMTLAILVPVSAEYNTPDAGNNNVVEEEVVIGGEKVEVTTTTTTKAEADGSVTETVVAEATTETGTVAETTTVTKTDKEGNVTTVEEIKATVAEETVAKAEEGNGFVTIPVAVSTEDAVVEITLPETVTEVKIEIPVAETLATSNTTVLVAVDAEGNETIIKTSVETENGLAGLVDGSVTIKVVDNAKDIEGAEGHWAEDAINFVAARELFADEGTVNPAESATRGDFFNILADFAGNGKENGQEWAVANGVSDGTMMDKDMTREQLITMLYRYAGAPEVEGELNFNDVDSVHDWAADAMKWAVSVGLINGVDASTLAPTGTVSIAQLATIIERFCKNIVM